MLASSSIKEIRMSTSNNRSTDEAEIRDLVESWARAVRTKNLDGIMANHSPEILMFDVPPPAQSKGIDAYKKTWDVFFAWFQDSGVFDIKELNITAGDYVAFGTALMRCSGTRFFPDCAGKKRFACRQTAGFGSIGSC
jgi:ketosteroid isomerase-like protein